jgi:hypothetical protein
MSDASNSDHSKEEEAKAPEGLSQFISKVLDQLSLTAWLPSAMLVGITALLLQLHKQGNLDIAGAIQDLVKKPLGITIVLLFALIVTAMIVQAFSFEAIRLLEGYWGRTSTTYFFLRLRVKRHRKRRQRLLDRALELEKAAFESARPVLISSGIDREHIEILEDAVYRVPSRSRRPHTTEQTTAARATGWRSRSSPALLAALERTYAAARDYPEEHRLLPTKLGNALRASEDSLSKDYGDLEGFIMRRYESIPARLMIQHDQFRNRLEMYCTLVLVFGLLAAGSPALLAESSRTYLAPAGGCALFLFLGMVSYAAAIASARGYGTVLRSVSRYTPRN